MDEKVDEKVIGVLAVSRKELLVMYHGGKIIVLKEPQQIIDFMNDFIKKLIHEMGDQWKP